MEEKTRVLPTHIVAAAGIVTNERDEILLVKTYDSGWVYPGGQVEVGENLIDALKREILEESGIEVEVGEVFCIASNTATYPGYNGVKVVPTKVVLDFICKKTGGTPRPSEENSETGWFAQKDVLSRIKSPAIIERFKAYLEYAGRPIYLEYVTHPSFELRVKRTI